MGPKKADKKKQQQKQAKQEHVFIREPVKLTDNLPKIPIKHRIQEIQKIIQADPYMMEKYIPEQKRRKYQKNFALFDRNHDGLLMLEEVKEFLISIGQMISEEDLKQFFKEMLTKSESEEGFIIQGLQLDRILEIVLEKKREQDEQEQLNQAFTILMNGNKEGGIQSDDFKQFLMTMGYKWPEEMADEFIKEFEPKSQKKIFPNDVIKKLMKK